MGGCLDKHSKNSRSAGAASPTTEQRRGDYPQLKKLDDRRQSPVYDATSQPSYQSTTGSPSDDKVAALFADFSVFYSFECPSVYTLLSLQMKDVSRADPAKLRAAFEEFDLDGDGSITKDELQQVMSQLGIQTTDLEVRAMLKAVDSDNDGKITIDEFMEMIKADPMKLSCRTVLAEMDVNNDGYVSKAEMRDALKRMGRHISDHEVDAVFDAIDKDGSGQITFEEFYEFIRPKD